MKRSTYVPLNIESELEDFVYELFTYTRKFEITFNYGLFNNLKDITMSLPEIMAIIQ